MPYDDTDYSPLNTTETFEASDRLAKRAFGIDVLGKRKPEDRIDYYIGNNQCPDSQDPQFQGTKQLGFFASDYSVNPPRKTMWTVAYQRRLMDENGNSLNNAFQFGTGSLHGCTMLTIVSKRAVWMVSP